MKRQTRKWRVICRAAGLLLLLLGLYCGYWWFYKLGPLRRVLDPQWVLGHSQQEHWREVQKGIARGMWDHDDGYNVGMCGDKSWAEWIMSHVKPGTNMGCFGYPCHSATAMRYITNQDAGEDADAWLEWWEKNKSKSQEQWLAEGFAQRGFRVDVPPTPGQTPMLLTLLGSPETKDSSDIRIFRPMKYNAFRCLRDSGFEPVRFALSNRPISANIERGLLEYAKLHRFWPEAVGLGILPFARKDGGTSSFALPQLLEPRFQATAHALALMPLAIGALLVIWSFRKRQQDVRQQPASG
jgi:hypothetical protein